MQMFLNNNEKICIFHTIKEIGKNGILESSVDSSINSEILTGSFKMFNVMPKLKFLENSFNQPIGNCLSK